jgi:hypothetical protein
MQMSLIERVVSRAGEFVEGLGYRLSSWSHARAWARHKAVEAARFGPSEDVGEPVKLTGSHVQVGGFVEAGPEDRFGIRINENGEAQAFVQRMIVPEQEIGTALSGDRMFFTRPR